MANRTVQDFYNNQVIREAVKAYFLNEIEKQAVDKLFKRGDVSHIADARDLINGIFKQMDTDFRPKKTLSTINGAR